MNDIDNLIWIRKYRPKTINEIVLDDKIRNFFLQRKKDKKLNNILLVGKPGIGKSSLAKIIAEDIMGGQYIYINASEENGIDTIRTKVITFIQTKSFDGGRKIVLLDEADGLSRQAQESLRNIMEEYLHNASFILTANYSHKIIEPLKSRCQSFFIEYDKKKYLKHVLGICKKEGVKISSKKDINYIQSFYPDFRKVLNDIQKNLSDGVIVHRKLTDNNFAENLFSMILDKEDPKTVRRYIIENEDQFENDYSGLASKLFTIICESDIKPKASALVSLGESIRHHPHVLDAEINLFTSILQIMEMLK